MEEVEAGASAEEAVEAVRLPLIAAVEATAAAAGPVHPAIVAVQPGVEVVFRHLTAAEGMINHLTAPIMSTILTIPMADMARLGILASIPSVDTTTAFLLTRCIGPG